MLTTVLLLLFIGQSATPQSPAKNTCVSCHQDAGGDIAEPIALVQNDAHGRRGLSCVNCHGGDATQDAFEKSMDPAKGFIGKPTPKQVSSFCGKCHSNAEVMRQYNPRLRVDQESEYATSIHGKKVAAGDPNPATCISCHGNHGILPVNDPKAPVFPTHVAETCGKCHANEELMKPYKISTSQMSSYLNSVHAEAMKKGDMSAPTCNDCHGNHGAAPPGTTSVGNVCGTCHARQAELFDASPLKPALDSLAAGECIACHSNHEIRHPTDNSVGTTSEAYCTKCHAAGEAGYEAAGAIHQKLTSLSAGIDAAKAVLDRAAQAGMEVSHARFELNDARDALINARVVVHSFSPEAVDKVTSPGLAIAAKEKTAGENALAELLFRRKGLAVSLVVIVLAIVSVYLKIRELEAKP